MKYLKKFIIPAFLLVLATSCYAAYDNPIGHDSLTSFLQGILVAIQGIAGWLAVIFIVIGGVLYLTASGKDSQITMAKNTIVAALIGFGIAVAGPSLLREIRDLALGPSGGATAIDNATPLADILANVLTFLLTLIGMLAVVGFIFSGLSYLSSGGDRSKADRAKKIALYSIIALAVSGGSLILVKTIIGFLDI